jgi:hypothetical protein
MRFHLGQWSDWPKKPTTYRKDMHQFRKVMLDAIVDDLTHELEALRADNVRLKFRIDEKYLDRNGWPMSRATTNYPGVILEYMHPKIGEVMIACDRFFEWRHNLRAIGLTVENLRQMERFGTVDEGQQFQGFRKLPAATGPTMSAGDAAKIIAQHSGLKYTPERILEVRELAEIAARKAIHDAHADYAANYDEDIYHSIERARQALGAHHGGTL